MPRYQRAFVPGGTFFFTVVTLRRLPIFRNPHMRAALCRSVAEVQRRRPFEIQGMVLLPDHLHCIWTLPPDDPDFSTRWRKIKEGFTRSYLAGRGTEARAAPGQVRKGHRGVWQQRFWEHTIRDDDDFGKHMDYMHFNPVKHEYASCPHFWPTSTFGRWVKRGVYDADWCCTCRGQTVRIPDFDGIAPTVGE